MVSGLNLVEPERNGEHVRSKITQGCRTTERLQAPSCYMGLFDTIHCKYPLPDPRLQAEEFQTKDLECGMESYTITADGRLVRHARRSGGNAALDRDVEWPLHGDIRIYTSDPDRERGLVDLVVRFTHGRVESIRRLEEGESPRGAPRPQPSTR